MIIPDRYAPKFTSYGEETDSTDLNDAGGIFWHAKIFAELNFQLTPEIDIGVEIKPQFGFGLTAGMDMQVAKTHQNAIMGLALTPTLAMTAGPHDIVTQPLSLTASLAANAVGHSVVSYSSSATSTFQNGVASPASFTWSNPSVVANSYAVVAIFSGYGVGFEMGAPTAATVTFGGVSLDSKGFVACNNNGNAGWIWVFAGDVSAAGTGSKTVAVTVTQNSAYFYGWGSSYTYTAVGSTGACQTAYGSSVSPSKAVSSATKHRVWGAILNSAVWSYTQSGFSLTQRQAKSSNIPIFTAGDAAGAGTVTVSDTISSSDDWAVAALDLIPPT